MKNLKIFIAIALFFLSVNVFGQYGSIGVTDARSMGLAKTYNSTSSGIYSIGINPARLSLNNQNILEISTLLPLPTFSVGTGSNFINLQDLNYFFGGVDGEPRYLTEQDKDRLNTLFDKGGLVFANVNAELFAVNFNPKKEIGSFAFAVYDFAFTKVNIPQALTEIALYGNPVGKTFNLNEADVKGWWIRNYSLSYAREIPGINLFDNFTAGFTVKLIHGYSYIGTHKNETSFTTGTSAELTGQTDLVGYSSFSDNFGVKYEFDSTSRSSKFSLFPSPAGTGYGLDVGFAGALSDKWTVALSVTDIGKIKWTKNVAEFTSFGYIYLDDISDGSKRDSIKETIISDSKKSDYINTNLATTLRFGISYLSGSVVNGFPGSLLLGFDYNQGFNDMPGNSLEPRFSLGAEWKPMNWIPFLRTGFSYGGGLGFSWAFGLGIDAGIVDLQFATSDMQSVVAPNTTKMLSVSLSSKWKF